MSDDLELVELVAARLCHDLVGPVGAIVNGVELLADGGPADLEVAALIAESARRASRRLQVYRVAYGSANALPGARRLDEVRRLLMSLCEAQHGLVLDWSADDGAERAAGKAGVKIAMILVLLALEALPRGGRVRASLTGDAARLTVRVEADGPLAKLPEEIAAAFSGGEPGPKAVPVVLARRLAAAAGGTVALAGAVQQLSFRAELPAGA